MNWELLIPLLVTSTTTVVSWFFLHRKDKERDIANKQKELRVNYLIDAWRRLEFAVNRKELNTVESIERPIADIQLFGTLKQIELAQKVANEMATDKKGNLNDLLEELRQDLRKELKLEKAPIEIKYLRIR